MACAALLTCLSLNVYSQALPDAGSLLRENERQRQQLPPPALKVAPSAPQQQLPGNDLRFVVKSFKLTGNTLVPSAELQVALASWVGREVSFNDLQEALNVVTQTYRSHGWLVRPQLPPQDVTDGVVSIVLTEGKLGAIRIDDQGKALRIQKDFISQSMAERQKPGDFLNLDDLDRSTSILNETPGLLVGTVLAPGQGDGKTEAVVKVQDKSLITAQAQVENQGARSTGVNKVSANGSLDDPFGIGDQVLLSANATEGSSYAKVGYSFPVNYDGWRAGLNTSYMKYHLVGELASLNAVGNAKTFGFNASYPILRSAARNVSFASSLDRKNYFNAANEVTTSDKTIDVFVASVSGDSSDDLGAGGLTLWSFNATSGQVDLSATSINETADRLGAQTAGGYTKFAYSLSRLQRITEVASVWFSVNGQTAGKNMDSSEKMSLGGPSGVRAYPVSEGTGDDGWQATVEGRFNIRADLQFIAFYDKGWIKQSHNADYIGAPVVNTGTLEGAGVGISWTQPGNFNLKATLARRIGDNPFANPVSGLDQDGSLDNNRFWVTFTKNF